MCHGFSSPLSIQVYGEREHPWEQNDVKKESFAEERKESEIADKASTGKAAVTNKDVTTMW